MDGPYRVTQVSVFGPSIFNGFITARLFRRTAQGFTHLLPLSVGPGGNATWVSDSDNYLLFLDKEDIVFLIDSPTAHAKLLAYNSIGGAITMDAEVCDPDFLKLISAMGAP